MAKLRGFQELTSIDEAQVKFFEAAEIKKPRMTSVPLDQALNRVSAETILAREDLPRVDRSAVDGYAIRAEDTSGASQFKPKTLTLTENQTVSSKHARRLWTGNPLPEGANAAVMLENTKQVEGRIEVWTPLAPGENVSKKGEDIAKGEVAVKAGIRLKPQHLGLVAALGIDKVKVFEQPKIAIFSTGNELAEVAAERQKDQIFDANRHVVLALCEELGARTVDLGIARDDPEEIKERLRRSLESDAVISTGGTSVGGSDLMPEAVNALGRPGVVVHGIAMRPAMPTALAVVDGRPIMIFPGNPVAAMIAFEVFARPLMCTMLGLNLPETRPTLMAKMTRRIATALGRRTFVRVHVFQQKGEHFADPVSAKGSGVISTMTRSNGYTIVPENREGLEEGELVQVYLFDVVGET